MLTMPLPDDAVIARRRNIAAALREIVPGEGVIDLIGFLQALKRIGYADGISPEPLGRVPQEMSAEDAARLALEATQAVMKRAGI